MAGTIAVLSIAILVAVRHYGIGLFVNLSSQEKPMSDLDRTKALVQDWAHMGVTKPKSADEFAALWGKSNDALAFYPDACQRLTEKVQVAFPERPGLAHGDIRTNSFYDPKLNPGGPIKDVKGLANLVMQSPRE